MLWLEPSKKDRYHHLRARPIISQDHHRLQLHRLLQPLKLPLLHTPMRTNPATSEGQVQLAIDLLASAMSGSVFQNCQVPPNWWGYGMPPDFMANSSGTSQVADVIGKAPMTSAPPLSPMTQNPQYYTITIARPFTGNSQMPTF